MERCHENGPGLATGLRGRRCKDVQTNGVLPCCRRCECISPKTGNPCRRRVCTGNVCWQHAQSHFGLRVKKIPYRTYFSRDGNPIRGLGKGLFAAVDIPRGCIIDEFTGQRLTQERLDRRYPGDMVANYALKTRYNGSRPYYYDVRDTTCNFARYANDARGLYKEREGSLIKVRNNAKMIDAVKRNGPPLLISTKRIKKGEQIFLSYGNEYWRNSS